MSRFTHSCTGSLFALLLLFAASAPDAQAQFEEKTKIERPDVVLHVEGLACAMCARSVTNELKKLGAIKDVEVLPGEDQRIRIALKKDATLSEKALRDAVTRSGFQTRKVVFARRDAAESTSPNRQFHD